MKSVLTALILVLLCGCAGNRIGHEPPTKATDTEPDFRRDQPAMFSPRERSLIRTARKYLEHSPKRPESGSDDAYYRVRRQADGYEVFIIYVTGYKGERPIFTPCVHNAVYLKGNGEVTRVLTGPECWPSQ